MGDRIMVLHDGKIQQTGTPLELYNEPANTFVGGFIGTPQMNFADARLSDGRLILNDALAVDLTEQEMANLPSGDRWRIGVRAEQIELAGPGQDRMSSVYVTCSEMMGNETQVMFEVGREQFTARWAGQYMIEDNRPLRITMSSDAFHFFDPQSSRLIRPALLVKGRALMTA